MRSAYSPRAHDADGSVVTTPEDSSLPGQRTWTARPLSRTTRVLLHVLAGFVALALSQIIAVQLYILPVSTELFESLAFPAGFAFVAGILEALAMMLVIFPRTRFFGAALTALLMVASLAIFIGLDFAIWPSLVALSLLAASLVLMWFYRGTPANLLRSHRDDAHKAHLRALREQHQRAVRAP